MVNFFNKLNSCQGVLNNEISILFDFISLYHKHDFMSYCDINADA